MASITFTDYSTVVPAAWLNDVNTLTYSGMFPATTLSVAIGTTPLAAPSNGNMFYVYNSLNTGTVESNSTVRIHSVNRNANVQIIGSTSFEAGVQFLSQAAVFLGGMTYNYATGDIFWRTSPAGVATETLRLKQSGNLLIASVTDAGSTAKLQVGEGIADTRAVFNPNNTYAIALKNGQGASAPYYIGATSSATPTLTFSNTAGTAQATLTDTGVFSVIGTASALGYGTGSGGTVTQLTSKATGVTLNKGSGKITMNNASLAATTAVGFICTNSLVGANDIVVLSLDSSTISNSLNYRYWTTVTAGSFAVGIENRTGGALAEAVGINFSIIKGATS